MDFHHNKSPSNLLIVSLINAVARSFDLNVSCTRLTVRCSTREIICCLISIKIWRSFDLNVANARSNLTVKSFFAWKASDSSNTFFVATVSFLISLTTRFA